ARVAVQRNCIPGRRLRRERTRRDEAPCDSRRAAGRSLRRARSGVRRPRPRRPVGERDRARTAARRRRAVSHHPLSRRTRSRRPVRRRVRRDASGARPPRRVLRGRVVERVLPSHGPERDEGDRPRGGEQRAPAAPGCACAPGAPPDLYRVLRRERRLPFRGRERAAEPGARPGPCPTRLPLLPGRARPGALGEIRRRLALARAGSSRTAPVTVLYDQGMATTAKTTALDPRDFLAVDALLDDEEKAIRDTVRQWVRDRVLPQIGEWFEEGILPRELVKEVAQLGLLGMHLEGYGLPGASSVAYGLTCMELEAGDSGVRSLVSVQGSL